jgi:hypothetical protein
MRRDSRATSKRFTCRSPVSFSIGRCTRFALPKKTRLFVGVTPQVFPLLGGPGAKHRRYEPLARPATKVVQTAAPHKTQTLVLGPRFTSQSVAKRHAVRKRRSFRSERPYSRTRGAPLAVLLSRNVIAVQMRLFLDFRLPFVILHSASVSAVADARDTYRVLTKIFEEK